MTLFSQGFVPPTLRRLPLPTVLVLLDLSSTSNAVDHEILVNRLQRLVGMSGPVSRCFSSYLVARSFRVAGNHRMLKPTS